MARLLLIDDDATLVTALTFALEDAGHVVTCAGDGLEGLRLAQQGLAQLLISDVNMPKLDGFSLCRKLREAGSQLPIVLLTSATTKPMRPSVSSLGPMTTSRNPSARGCCSPAFKRCCEESTHAGRLITTRTFSAR